MSVVWAAGEILKFLLDRLEVTYPEPDETMLLELAAYERVLHEFEHLYFNQEDAALRMFQLPMEERKQDYSEWASIIHEAEEVVKDQLTAMGGNEWSTKLRDTKVQFLETSSTR